jgi:hypothetical protein
LKELRLLIVLIFFLAQTGFSQEPAITFKLYSIVTRDGNTYIGKIMSQTNDSVWVQTDNLGILHFSNADIRTRIELDPVTNSMGKYWLPNPQSSRYFWAPNGYGLKAGEAYFQNIWVLYNQVSAGLTNYFSIGGGIIPLFLLDSDVIPVWLVPKFSFPIVKEKFNLGAGAFLGTIIGEDAGIFGLLYGTSTFGSRDKNMSIGMAYGFGGGDWMKKPLINLSTMVRVGPKWYFISENYIIPFEDQVGGAISVGGRSIIGRISLDYSLWIPVGVEIGAFFALPFIGITVPL